MCDCLARFLHPRRDVDAKYTNAHHKHRISDLLLVKRDVVKVNSKEQMCYFFNHPDFDDRLLYCVVRYARVKQEGELGSFFDALPASEETVVDAVVVHE